MYGHFARCSLGMNLLNWVVGLAIGLVWLIVGTGVLVALQRRGFDPAGAIGRFLSPAESAAAFEG